MARVSRRLRMIGGRFLSALGLSAIPIGILAPLSPSWWEGKWWLVIGVVLLAIGWALLGLRQPDPKQTYRDVNVTVKLVFGDIFKQDASVMIGMTSTFDTAPGIIAETSLQANFLKDVYGGSVSQFDQALTDALAGTASVGTIAKPGKQTVYPVGTVATVPTPSGVCYYCAAYTTMNAANVATGSIRGVLDSLDSAWDAADRTGNGRPICVPLIGQGQARIAELTPEIAVRLIAFSFLLRSKRSRFANELRIVIHPSERHKINATEFQAFLTSLVTG